MDKTIKAIMIKNGLRPFMWSVNGTMRNGKGFCLELKVGDSK